jgi:Thioesterase-like superfamily
MASEISFYTHANNVYEPTELAMSPWNGQAQSGVALAGLTAHLLGKVPTPVPMLTARVTMDILGTVPMHTLLPSTRVIREGKRLQMLEIELASAGRPCVRASALRMRTAASPARALTMTHPFPSDAVQEMAQRHSKWVETIRVAGDYGLPGPGTRWVRFLCSVVAGETLSPLESAAMLADFGSGIGPLASPREWTFANVDICVHLTRLPRGDWLLIDAASESAGNGVGLASSRLGDRDGMFGSGHQTIYLDPRMEDA